MVNVAGGTGSTERVPQIWGIYPLFYDVKVEVLIDSLLEECRCLPVLSHEDILIVKLEARLANSLERVKDCLCSPMIRPFPEWREDWRLIHASWIKCKAQCNPNYCTGMTHSSLLFPIHCLCLVFHKTKSKLRMPALSLQYWSREGRRHSDAYLFIL